MAIVAVKAGIADKEVDDVKQGGPGQAQFR
jgi:hypothetical protein